jgi:pyrroline-5-carboxylate reductase
MKVGFAGSGNMAGALARGLAACGTPPEAMLFADSGSGRAKALADELGGERAGSLEELADASDLVILAVKPAGLDEAAPAIAGRTGGVVSVLGATTVERLEGALAPTPVVRLMPNLAVEVCHGVICRTPLPDPAGSLPEALEMLASVARIYELEEELIDPATAVMGCAPAYIALAAEALVRAGAEAGLPEELSGELVREAAAGVGKHLLSRDPAEMQRAIASPGGSTEAGLDVLAERAVRDAYRAAVAASLRRMEGVA